MNLKELSEHLNLSQTTVSRALNGYPEVSETTRLRVLEAAQAMNYIPNARAQSLATGRTLTIGHVIPISSSHEMVNPIFGDFLAGAGAVYSDRGYEMLLSIVPDQNQEATYRDIKARGTVDGVIVQGPSVNDARIPLLTELGVPFVVHGRSSEVPTPYSYIDVNNRRAFESATEHQAKLGHKRIALINGLESMDFAFRRRDGYLSALAEAGLDPDPALMRSDEMTEAYGFAATSDMLSQDNPPTAFVVASLITAIGVRRAVEAMGLRVGRDISVITFDDDLSYLRNGGAEPIFTAVRSSVNEAGQLAAKLLIDTVEGRDTGPRQILLETEMVIGSSTCEAK